MTRDLARLEGIRFDLVVVGAGIYGAIAAWDAALRGLSVALIDRADIGAATSFNNLKTLHGGLRSLQSMNFRQMRLFIRERRALARIAPHLVEPLAFVVPTYSHPARAALTMRVALALNDLVAHDRHEGLEDPALHLPAGRILSRDECLKRNPLIDPAGVTGGAVWHDYQMPNTDRLTLSFVLSASAAGAVVGNYVSAIGLLRDGARVAGVHVEDRLGGARFDIRASSVLNACGPWAPAFLERAGVRSAVPAPRLSRAMNLVTTSRGITQGCGGLSRGRFLFFVPWRSASIVGTSHDVHEGDADALRVTRQDLHEFLSEVSEAFPRARLTVDDVRLVHRGLLPMVVAKGHRVSLLRESAVVDHTPDGAPGLISMFGVRYTTARHTAAAAIDAVFRARGDTRIPPCRTHITPVVGGDIVSKARLLATAATTELAAIPPSTLRRLALTYGTAYDRVLRLVRDDQTLAQALSPDCGVIGAEIVHAVRSEAAVTLADALIRRTAAGAAGHPGAEAVARAAALMQRELGWDDVTVRREIASVDTFYALPT